MKRLISVLLHLFSIGAMLIVFCLLKINFPKININNYFEQPTFTSTQEYKDITIQKIKNVFSLIDYINIYEIKGKTNYDTIVATSLINNTYYDWKLSDVINLANAYGIFINDNFSIDENDNPTTYANQRKELYTNLIYDKNISISNLSTNRMTEYDFCKKILSHFSTYQQLKNEFADNNSNFSYIIRYYTDTKQKEFYNNNATLNDIFTSKSFIYISNDINQIKTNIDVDNNTILQELTKRIPFKDANYYFACSIDLSLNKNDIYKNVFDTYNTNKRKRTILIYTLIGTISLFLITFISTLILCITTPKMNEKSSNPILYIPTEILFIIALAIGITSYILIPKSTIISELSKMTNSNIALFITLISIYLCTILFFIIINEKYIGQCTPEPRFILGIFTTIATDLSKVFKTIPIFSYVFFFFIPMFLLGVFTLYCFYKYTITPTSFTIITCYVCAFLFLLFIIFIIIVNRGFLKTINQSTKSDKLREDLITNVSHDIRTPLTSIINYTDLLSKEIDKDTFNKPQISHYIDILADKSNRLKKLIDNLVFSSKASSGNLELNLQKLNITELTYQLLADYEDKFKKRELHVITNIQKSPIYIYADGDKIYRIYENLFDNIVKYALHDTDINITIKESNKKAIINITNISSEDIKHPTDTLTDRFVRGDDSRNTKGFGLGLSIVKDLMRLMNGNLTIEFDNSKKLFTTSLQYNIYYGF